MLLYIKCQNIERFLSLMTSSLMSSLSVTDISGAIVQQQARPDKRSGHCTCTAQNVSTSSMSPVLFPLTARLSSGDSFRTYSLKFAYLYNFGLPLSPLSMQNVAS